MQQLGELEEDRGKYEEKGAQLMALAVQSQDGAANTLKQTKVQYPILADTDHAVAEAYNVLKDAWTAKTPVAIKWQPKGSAGQTYTTSVHRMTKRKLPGGDASNGDTIICAFTMKCASVTETL